jgi:tripartite-type tricarboxylate transporter receptor subunit TctC
MTTMQPFARSTAAALAIIVPAATHAYADAVSDFYRGKQVTLVVGYGTGGGYDVYARLIARHLGKYIPGNPGIIVQNMPGAGSLRSVNYLYNVAPRDGSVIGAFARDMPLLGIIGHPNARFDAGKLTWLGSSSS